jgi:16S rRNA A1518/A1519 N6-dimethyltransferase RsmA/KsgA/DIM1 with predicted DNA glycosylase/AP lyase activity
LAERLIGEADIEPHHRVLEPSAGTGNLLRGLNAVSADCVAVEFNHSLAATLAAQFPHVSVRQADFLQCNGDLGKFDRIVMNPPFAKGQDIEHVQHALHMLKPGGRLVAIMSAGVAFRQDAEEFRALVADLGGCIDPLPDDAFKASGTNVRTVLVTI